MENSLRKGGERQFADLKTVIRRAHNGFQQCRKRLSTSLKAVFYKVKNRLLQGKKHAFSNLEMVSDKEERSYPSDNQSFVKSRKIAVFSGENTLREQKGQFFEPLCQTF